MAKITAPKSGVKIRMYRQGHGDCFLLAFAGDKADGTPVIMLIGEESWCAVCRPMTPWQAPGPRVTITTPGFPVARA